MNKYLLPHSLIVKLMSLVSDETYIKIKWKNWMDYKLNLDNPRTFNEKLQWIKLNDIILCIRNLLTNTEPNNM